ncbi:unnamed protein product [Victoria cruziana]
MLAPLFLVLFPPFGQPASKPLTLTLTRMSAPTPDSHSGPWTKPSLLFPIEAAVDSTVSVFPRSSGDYALTLSFSTPPQPFNFSLDISTSLAWFPCTQRFRCPNCPSSSSKISYFPQKSSSSARFFGCKDPKCQWIHRRMPANCSSAPASCPPYFLISGGGINGGGLLLSATLSFSGKQVVGFAIGCSLGARSFSYCLPSHRLDDALGTKGVLVVGADPLSGKGFTYTPFMKNPAGSGAFYYLGLDAVTVGGVAVGVMHLGPGGDGGAIIDSGTTFTIVEATIHEQLVEKFTRQVRSSLRPCFDVTGQKTVMMPEMALQFEGRAIMKLLLKNYFSFVGKTDVICLTVVGDGGGGGSGVGPVVLLGNFQQRDMYMVFDADREKLGFRQ